jgi:hypothetical protein
MQKIGKYEVIRLIGEGGMGRVHEASDPVINRRVAIKTVSQAVLGSPEARARFLREAQAAGQLSHPNLITIFDVGEHDGVPYIVMELLEGEELTDTIAKGKLSVEMKLRVMSDVCRGLAYAHAKGLVHRDIKPANIFVTTERLVKILDFGLARGLMSDVTQTGNVVGTPSYMAPEQVRGETIDQRSDVFSAGVVLYELLSGKRPFKGDSVAATIFSVLEHEPEPLDRIDPNMNPDLARIVERALAKLPAARYQRIDDMLADLTTITAAGEQKTLLLPNLVQPQSIAPPPSIVQTRFQQRASNPAAQPAAVPAPAPPRSVPVRWVALAMAAVVVVAAIAVVLMRGRSSEEPAPAAALPAQASAPPPATAPAAPSAPVPAPGARLAETPRTAAAPPAPQTAAPSAATPAPRAANEPPQTKPVEPPQVAREPVPQPERQPPIEEPRPAPAVPPATAPAPVAAPPPPPAPTAAPAAPPPPAPVDNSAAAVQELVARYKSALEARDLGALKQIWPALGGRQETAMKAEFDNARAIAVTLQGVSVSIAGTTATVTCRRDYVVTTSDRKTLNSATRMTMTLERKNGAWTIDTIRHEAAR